MNTQQIKEQVSELKDKVSFVYSVRKDSYLSFSFDSEVRMYNYAKRTGYVIESYNSNSVNLSNGVIIKRDGLVTVSR